MSGMKGPPFPLPSLRLMVPPLRLVSAAIWQTVQQRHVMDYGMLEEFVTMVTEMVPELLNHSQRAQLILGLRARLVLELCRSKPITDLQTIQPHLDRIQTLTPLWGTQATDAEVGLSESNFLGLVQTLLKDPDEREHFFQAALLLSDVPSVLEECVESVSHPQELKTLLQYHRDLSPLDNHDPPSSTDGDCILSALCLPPVERVVISTEVEREGTSMDVKEREGVESRSGECEKNKTSSVSDEDDAEFADQVTDKVEPKYETVMVIGEDGMVQPFEDLSVGKNSYFKKPKIMTHKASGSHGEQMLSIFNSKSNVIISSMLYQPSVDLQRIDTTNLILLPLRPPLKCTMCENSFNGVKPLKKHYLDVHKFNGPFLCTYCEKSFTELSDLVRHERTHTLPYQCSHCPKKCKSSTTLAEHERIHTGEKCLCWECGKGFINQTTLRNHMLNVHSKPEDKHSCSQCDKSYGEKRALVSPPLPLPSLRLMVPPLRLVSAAIWQTVQQRQVMDYGMLEEFVTMVTEMVPELLNNSQRAQLILGLRARLVLELCCSKPITDLQTIQPHLDRIQTLTPLWGTQADDGDLSESNFLGLIQTLLKDPDEMEHFFQDVFPVEFGPKYDAAIEKLMCQFLSRLEKLLPVSNFQQAAFLLGDVPSVLEECVESVSHPQELKTLLQYHRDLSPLDNHDTLSSTDGDCILSALCLPPVERVVIATEQTESETQVSSLNVFMDTFTKELEVDSATLTEYTEMEPGTSMDVVEREERVECERNNKLSIEFADPVEHEDMEVHAGNEEENVVGIGPVKDETEDIVEEVDSRYETVMVIGADGVAQPYEDLRVKRKRSFRKPKLKTHKARGSHEEQIKIISSMLHKPSLDKTGGVR
ncbi:unnamed protein product [Coregonus sp. 'balchen']|nr:unnamed protein product [Coregonus sp. 'balchen']